MPLLLPGVARSQMYSTGVGKTTHCVSNASAALGWLLRHLPVAQDVGGFPCVPGGAASEPGPVFCACGQVGRVEIERSPPSRGRRPGLGFGLHTVHTNRMR